MSICDLSILIVDDQPSNADALEAIFPPHFRPVVRAHTREQFWEQSKRSPSPDVVIMDLVLDPLVPPTGENGGQGVLSLDGLQLIRESQHHDYSSVLAFVVYTQFHHIQMAIESYKSGALAFCHKVEMPADAIVTAIESAANGTAFISDSYSPLQYNRCAAYTHPELRTLSQDEIDIISHLNSGLSYSEIARILEYTHVQSLRNKVSRLIKKTPFESAQAAALFAARNGWKQTNDNQPI